jgi:DNA-binding SARP family transcriptional activator/tRNA A-37 threonylcarbamoyl transferase component Bud32
VVFRINPGALYPFPAELDSPSSGDPRRRGVVAQAHIHHATEPMSIQLRVLGGATLEVDEEPVHGRAAHRRRIALLTTLASSPHGSVRRERLAELLWPDADGKPLHSLAESLHILRSELHRDIVLTAGNEVALNPEVVRCDAVEFRAAIEAEEWNRAVALYAGPFLDGFFVDRAPEFERWVEEERAALGRVFARALEALAVRAERAGNVLEAVEAWGRLAVHDPYSARVALRLMAVLAEAGERARAIQFGTAFVRRLREELEIEPEAEIQELLERMRVEAPRMAASAPPAGGPLPPPQVREEGGRLEESASCVPQLSAEFDVLRRIGEGSVAAVYLAREPALGRLVAIKVLADRFVGDVVAERRFEREARASAGIQHPNVATVFRIGRTAAGVPFLVLPYVDGGSLEDRLAAAGRLPIAEARRYVGQAAAALAAAHRMGIVHRDLRPANLLYDRATDRVLLGDFGLAAVLETGQERVMRLTRPGESLGDPRYASPEQLAGEPVTERTDVYSLGMVAFELLTGRSPFDASTGTEMLVAHVRQAPRRTSELRDGIDPELDDLIHRCLNKRPEHRPFAVDVADALG